MADIQILVGSVKGTAEKTAQAVAVLLERLEHRVELNYAPLPADLMRDPQEILIVCCSTTGKGELPDNMYPLYNRLDDGVVDLTGRVYGAIALGDSYFREFAQGGLMMENALYRAGAKRVGEICMLDAQFDDNQPKTAMQWAVNWQVELATVSSSITAG